MLGLVGEKLNEEAAQQLISLKADPDLQARMDELAEKANEGTLTPAERVEYEDSIAAGNLLNILKAIARVQLENKKAG